MGQVEVITTFYKEWLVHPNRWITVKEAMELGNYTGDSSAIYKQIKKLVLHGYIRREFKGMQWRNRYRFNKSYVKAIKRLISI